MTYNEKIGKFLIKCRKAKKITQQELANELYVTDKAVSKWERGICLPDISLLQKLAKIFNLTVDDLLNGEKNNIENKETTLNNGVYYLKKLNKDQIEKGLKITFMIISILSLISILLCLGIEFILDKSFTWSLITITAITSGYLILLSAYRMRNVGKVLCLTTMITSLMLYVFSILLSNNLIINIGGCVTILSAIMLYIFWKLILKFKKRVFLILGLISLISVVFNCIIHGILYFNLKDYELPINSLGEQLSIIVNLIIGIIFIVIDKMVGDKIENNLHTWIRSK